MPEGGESYSASNGEQRNIKSERNKKPKKRRKIEK